ncbi:MAG: hypothetical protein UIB61_08775 [Treponema sp.]|nr:hypothetical protein [Treponema sp.]
MDKRKKLPVAKSTGRITKYNSKDIFSSNDETVFFTCVILCTNLQSD